MDRLRVDSASAGELRRGAALLLFRLYQKRPLQLFIPNPCYEIKS
jgi:hypothetical protein